MIDEKSPIDPELQSRIERVSRLKCLAGPRMDQEEELAMLDLSPPVRFDVNDPSWLQHLDEKGYVVVMKVAGADEVQRLRDLLWDFLEANTSEESKWKREDPRTWTDKGFGEVGRCSTGIINGAGVGHSEFLWAARTLPAVRTAFSKIWGTSSLLASFDGCNVFRPWDGQDPLLANNKTMGGWWHVDQGRSKIGSRHAVQGLVSLYDQDANTGGLCVMPASHSRHAEVCEDASNNGDFVDVQHYLPGFREMPRKLVSCCAGDLVLWDSRTIHCNTPSPKSDRSHQDGARLLRAVAYVCMTPKALASEEVLAGRRDAYNWRTTTSHWPHLLHRGPSGAPKHGARLDLSAAGRAVQELIS